MAHVEEDVDQHQARARANKFFSIILGEIFIRAMYRVLYSVLIVALHSPLLYFWWKVTRQEVPSVPESPFDRRWVHQPLLPQGLRAVHAAKYAMITSNYGHPSKHIPGLWPWLPVHLKLCAPKHIMTFSPDFCARVFPCMNEQAKYEMTHICTTSPTPPSPSYHSHNSAVPPGCEMSSCRWTISHRSSSTCLTPATYLPRTPRERAMPV